MDPRRTVYDEPATLRNPRMAATAMVHSETSRVTDFLDGLANQTWMRQRRCSTSNADVFFASRGEGGKTMAKRAKGICAGCPVSVECLQFALDNNERFGIFGGLTASERTELLREERGSDVA